MMGLQHTTVSQHGFSLAVPLPPPAPKGHQMERSSHFAGKDPCLWQKLIMRTLKIFFPLYDIYLCNSDFAGFFRTVRQKYLPVRAPIVLF